MELGSLLILLSLLVLVALFISRPFFEPNNSTEIVEEKQSDHQRSSLLAERDQVLTALQELDFDYSMGKIPAEDYPHQRASLVERGVNTLKQLDQFQEQSNNRAIEEQIEAMIAARREDTERPEKQPEAFILQTDPVVAGHAPDDELEILLANRKRSRNEKAAGFCPSCGKPIQKSDRFCHKCGAALTDPDR